MTLKAEERVVRIAYDANVIRDEINHVIWRPEPLVHVPTLSEISKDGFLFKIKRMGGSPLSSSSRASSLFRFKVNSSFHGAAAVVSISSVESEAFGEYL